ncbi:MAG: AmmeMemoRadiSam system radical SAM enzyme [SAR324 cluster bacterium]|uniref:AmmeMemoRadiSam system radical SAM enzyme n=1 Tax=SAR324 cluster bacterium TaxID=2024889 RepID=A0A7X9IJH4_9DELT|nr:AmmeMemoRadiSam system radical SAM enzyme [SAR324 cluster bacterium]
MKGEQKETVSTKLNKYAREADWYQKNDLVENGPVQCELCPHACILDDGTRGSCRVRVAKDGKLYTTAFGNPCAAHVDPIEKKPFYHFLPETKAFSIATAGCNLHCLNCQNWEISQSRPEDTDVIEMPPQAVVENAINSNSPSIAYTYTEPMVFYEYTYETAALAREKGIKNLLVTAGYINPEPLRKLCKVVDGANVDIKGFDEQIYKKLNAATLSPVLRTLEIMREEGLWVEVGNLIVPTLSDNLENIRKMCKWIVKHLGADTPLHFLRFHPTHKLKGLPLTPGNIMLQSKEIALECGLRYVYLGNVPEQNKQDTICPNCSKSVIERDGFFTLSNKLEGGKCSCGNSIPGIWA